MSSYGWIWPRCQVTWQAGAWVLLTESVPAGVLALWVLVTHVMYMQDYWRTWLRGLRGFFFVGALFSAVSVSAFCTFLALAITQHQSEDRPGKEKGEGLGLARNSVGYPGSSRDWMASLTSSPYPLPGFLTVQMARKSPHLLGGRRVQVCYEVLRTANTQSRWSPFISA